MKMYFIKRNLHLIFPLRYNRKDMVKVDELRYQVRYTLGWGRQGKNQEHPSTEVSVRKHLKGDTWNRTCDGKT